MPASEFMRLALDEAEQALGFTSPNPAVGAVVVRDGRVVGRGLVGAGSRDHRRHRDAQERVGRLLLADRRAHRRVTIGALLGDALTPARDVAVVRLDRGNASRYGDDRQTSDIKERAQEGRFHGSSLVRGFQQRFLAGRLLAATE